MKTFIYYSPANQEVIAVVADNSFAASDSLVGLVSDKIIKDYYLASSCNNTVGSSAVVDINAFDSINS